MSLGLLLIAGGAVYELARWRSNKPPAVPTLVIAPGGRFTWNGLPLTFLDLSVRRPPSPGAKILVANRVGGDQSAQATIAQLQDLGWTVSLF